MSGLGMCAVIFQSFKFVDYFLYLHGNFALRGNEYIQRNFNSKEKTWN